MRDDYVERLASLLRESEDDEILEAMSRADFAVVGRASICLRACEGIPDEDLRKVVGEDDVRRLYLLAVCAEFESGELAHKRGVSTPDGYGRDLTLEERDALREIRAEYEEPLDIDTPTQQED